MEKCLLERDRGKVDQTEGKRGWSECAVENSNLLSKFPLPEAHCNAQRNASRLYVSGNIVEMGLYMWLYLRFSLSQNML